MLSSNVTIRAPRKCGFCKEPGHNILTCDSVYRYSEVLFQTAFVKIQTDVLEKKNGDLFEQWVYELEEDADLKYLVWKITNAYNSYDIIHNRNIVLEYFARQNVGYVLQSVRRTRNYYKVYQAMQLDIIYETKGIEINNCLKNLMSENEVDDVYFKIIKDYSNSTRDETFQREFDNWYIQSGLMMPHKHFVIHCHFSELGIGYYFQIQNIPGYIERNIRHISQLNLSNEFEDEVAEEEEVWSDNEEEPDEPDLDIHIDFLQNILILKYTKNGVYPVQSQIDYQINKKNCKNDTELHENCCAVCMDTKQKKEYLVTDCNHSFCNLCTGQIMVNSISQYKSFNCPLCRTKVSTFNYYNETAIHTMFYLFH
jgi:hypothetical protein